MALVRLFEARFDPDAPIAARAEDIGQEIESAIDAVESLDEDRILRSFLAVVRAMLRTNHFRMDAAGAVPGLPVVQARPRAVEHAARARGRGSRSSCTPRGWRGSTCAAARLPAAACAGLIGERTSAPRCWG